ncbi:MAG: hypothetical protein K2N71_01120 [Oscillospiraceae bacterium]|nr:hypothetical protein [Oscillospiraceae bacterium]
MNKSLFSKIKIPIVIIGVILVLFAALEILTYMPKGKFENAKISIGASDVFSKSDFEQAKKAIFEEFKNYDGCEMLSLVYDENMSDKYKNYFYPDYDLEIMVLYSDFKTQKNMYGNGFNNDCLYREWKWIMVKNDGEWTVGDRGLP